MTINKNMYSDMQITKTEGVNMVEYIEVVLRI